MDSRDAWSRRAAAAGLMELCPDGTLVAVNEVYCKLLGRSRKELLGHSPVEFTHPADADASGEALSSAHWMPGVDCQLEKRFVRGDGQVVWVRVTEIWRPDLQRVLGHAVDITETVRLRQSGTRYDPDVVAAALRVTPADGRPLGSDADGWQRDELAVLRYDRAALRNELAMLRDQTAELRAENGAIRDAAGAARDGAQARRDVVGSAGSHAGAAGDEAAELRDREAEERDRDARLFEASGEAGTDADALDRSEAARSEAADNRNQSRRDRRLGAAERAHADLDRGRSLDDRRESVADRAQNVLDRAGSSADRRASAGERVFAGLDRDLLDLASDAIFIRDDQHRVTYWNAGAEALFGWTATEAAGQDAQHLLRTEFPTPFDDSEASLTSTGHCERQLVQYNKAGNRLDVDSRWSARYGPDGALSSVLVINTDITARRAAERQATERAAELGALNSELNRSNAELEQFAYIASHDLAEPLRAISGPVSLLARRYQGQLDPDADRFIEFAVDGCQRMQTLIDDLLTLSRTGRVDGPPVAIDTNALLTRVLADLTPSIDARHAHITVDELPPVRGDTTQLRQLFQNLIANAVKFTPAGAEPRIHIGGSLANGQNTFTITDNGIGIDARHRERVFGMFKRLHSRDEYPGTGIGLALCKKIVERHHGTIDVADGPDGIGSTFTVTLPTLPEHTP